MISPRVPLFQRLPEIYRIRDAEQVPPGQLEAYLAVFEEAFGAIHANIEDLYDDLFIDTCQDWVIPYIADLLGTSHLKGDPWTLRADVANTIPLRRRKGTLAAVQALASNLTTWAVHGVELRHHLVRSLHLNHQRPAPSTVTHADPASQGRFAIRYGGPVPLRSPASLSLLSTAFDPFPRIPDFRPPNVPVVRHNLPNLALFLWRLQTHSLPHFKPLAKINRPLNPPNPNPAQLASFAVGFDLHPLDRPVQLFNGQRHDPQRPPGDIIPIDDAPGPVLAARLNSESPSGCPDRYVCVRTADTPLPADKSYALQLILPNTPTTNSFSQPRFRGENLCAWETGLQRPLLVGDVAVDPVIGRVLLGAANQTEATNLFDQLRVAYTYASVGPVGAHPIPRDVPSTPPNDVPTVHVTIKTNSPPNLLSEALARLLPPNPSRLILTLEHSDVQDLNLTQVSLGASLVIRAHPGHRPIVRLREPLQFQIHNPSTDPQHGLPPEQQSQITVRLEGLYLTRHPGFFPKDQPLVAQAAVGRLEIIGCTLDPGGFRERDGSRSPILPSLILSQPYYPDPDPEKAFAPTPDIVLHRSVAGPLLVNDGYRLFISESIIDAGKGVGDDSSAAFALAHPSDPSTDWAATTVIRGVTFLGQVRSQNLSGSGGIFVHPLHVHDNQNGCIHASYFSGDRSHNTLPRNSGCVFGNDAPLRLASHCFEHPAYAQLARGTSPDILQLGPAYPTLTPPSPTLPEILPATPAPSATQDAMGAFGFLLEAQKWANLAIRLREFMPVGVRPLLIPIT